MKLPGTHIEATLSVVCNIPLTIFPHIPLGLTAVQIYDLRTDE